MKIVSDKTVVARILHNCNFCNGSISPGTTYRTQFITDNAESWQWKSHIACDKLADIYHNESGNNGELITEDFFRECVKDDYKALSGQAEQDIINKMTPFFDMIDYVMNVRKIKRYIH